MTLTDPYDRLDQTAAPDVIIGAATFQGRKESSLAPGLYSGDASGLATNYNGWANTFLTSTVRVYRDVPYTAAPPARFTSPAEGVPSGTIDCTRFRHAPYQEWVIEDTEAYDVGRWPTGLENGPARWHAFGMVESEDIARCTIYGPDAETVGPTIIFLPGGGGDVGSASAPYYWAHRLASEGPRVVVGNYPRGYLGHFNHPDLIGGPNYALDHVKALIRWTVDNIASFGGDPSNITLMGGSFGGALVLAALEDAAIKALVNRVVIVSGGGGGDRRRAIQTRQRGLKSYTGICADRLAAIEAVVPRGGEAYSSYLRSTVPPEMFVAVHDGQNIFLWEDGSQVTHRNAVEAVKAGALDGLDVVFVVAPNEASVLGITKSTDTFNVNRQTIASLLGFPGGQPEMEASSIIDGGLNTTEENVLLYSLALYWWPAYLMAKLALAGGANVSLIYDNYKSAGNGSDFTAHTSFTGYALGGLCVGWKTGMDGDEAKLYAQDMQHSDAVVRGIKNFANTGALTGTSGLNHYCVYPEPAYVWSPFTLANEEWNVLGVDSLFGAGATASNTIVNNWRSGVFSTLSALPMNARILA